MNGLLKYNYADPDATGVAHDNIDGMLAENRLSTAMDIGTIGPQVDFLDTKIGNTLLDAVVGGAPGAAIGRISKAAITGGSSIFPRLTKSGKYLQQKELPKSASKAIAAGRSFGNWTKFNEYFKRPSAKWHSEQNKVNSNRIAMEKALDKHKIPHQRGNPAQPEEPLPLMDSVSELLHALRFRKN